MKNKIMMPFFYHYIYRRIQFIYPQGLKYPTRKAYFFSKWLVPVLFLLLLITTNACKTCKCPAYSYQAEEGERVRLMEIDGDLW